MKRRARKPKRIASSKKPKPQPSIQSLIIKILTEKPFLMSKGEARQSAGIILSELRPAMKRARARIDKLDFAFDT
jgi:hypothetical protein